MSNIDLKIQGGPCIGCGATNYPLSMGGPSICPLCDSIPPHIRVHQLAETNRKLTAELSKTNEILERIVQKDPSMLKILREMQATLPGGRV
jgi:hypothetical protein